MVIHCIRSPVSAAKKKNHALSQMSKQLVQAFSGEILAYTLTFLAGI